MSYMDPTKQTSPVSQSPQNVTPTNEARGRGKHKCYWKEKEMQLLIEILQDMANDPLWKPDGGFRSNYLSEVHKRILIKMLAFSKQVSPYIESKVKWLKTRFHIVNDMLKQSGCQWNNVDQNLKEAKGMWDFKFSFFNQLVLLYGRDRATGGVVEGTADAVRNMGIEQNVKSGGENVGVYHVSLSDDEENDVQFMSQTTQSASNMSNAGRMARKQRATCTEDKATKKRKRSSEDMVARLEGTDQSFRTFVEEFNVYFATMANVVATAMTDDNTRQRIASEKLRNMLAELVRLNIPNCDILQVADIFSTNKDMMDVFLNLPLEL